MTVIQETWIEADPPLLWRAWTESARITQWFAPAAEIEPRAGGKFELYFNPAHRESMCTAGCTILLYDEPSTLAFEWKGPDPFAKIMNEGELTAVKVSFIPDRSGTRITLEHTGWKDSGEWLQAREWHVQAWEGMLASLKSSIESGEGVLCCE